MHRRRLLITDLDNTLWDWFESWYQSFSALLDQLVDLSGVDRKTLENEIKSIHQSRGTTEYSNLVREVPSLIKFAGEEDPMQIFNAALHAQNSRRKASIELYPGVKEALERLKREGVQIVAYTESGAFWTEWRIRNTGLDGVIDVLYSSEDHDLAAGVDTSDLRTGHYDNSDYGLQKTRHSRIPVGVLKPNAAILKSILEENKAAPDEAVYIGDSLMKDIIMAQDAGVLDAHAEYGVVQNKGEYNLLRQVTHWTDEDVERERKIAASAEVVVPTVTCRSSFVEVLPLFGICPGGDQ